MMGKHTARGRGEGNVQPSLKEGGNPDPLGDVAATSGMIRRQFGRFAAVNARSTAELLGLEGDVKGASRWTEIATAIGVGGPATATD